MRVRELREWLANMPDDWAVVVSKDAEGNGFRKVDSLCQCVFRDGWIEEPVTGPVKHGEHAICIWTQ